MITWLQCPFQDPALFLLTDTETLRDKGQQKWFCWFCARLDLGSKRTGKRYNPCMSAMTESTLTTLRSQECYCSNKELIAWGFIHSYSWLFWLCWALYCQGQAAVNTWVSLKLAGILDHCRGRTLKVSVLLNVGLLPAYRSTFFSIPTPISFKLLQPPPAQPANTALWSFLALLATWSSGGCHHHAAFIVAKDIAAQERMNDQLVL